MARLAERFADTGVVPGREQPAGAVPGDGRGHWPRHWGSTSVLDEDLQECAYGAWTGRQLAELVKEPLWATVQDDPAQCALPRPRPVCRGEPPRDERPRRWRAVRRHRRRGHAPHGERGRVGRGEPRRPRSRRCSPTRPARASRTSSATPQTRPRSRRSATASGTRSCWRPTTWHQTCSRFRSPARRSRRRDDAVVGGGAGRRRVRVGAWR